MPKQKPIIEEVQKVGKQVQTVYVPEARTIELRCPVCQTSQDKIGSAFCFNCGEKLEWKNIFVQKTEPKSSTPEVPQPEEKKPEVESQESAKA